MQKELILSNNKFNLANKHKEAYYIITTTLYKNSNSMYHFRMTRSTNHSIKHKINHFTRLEILETTI